MNKLGLCTQQKCRGSLCVGWLKELQRNIVRCDSCGHPYADHEASKEIAAFKARPAVEPAWAEAPPVPGPGQPGLVLPAVLAAMPANAEQRSEAASRRAAALSSVREAFVDGEAFKMHVRLQEQLHAQEQLLASLTERRAGLLRAVNTKMLAGQDPVAEDEELARTDARHVALSERVRQLTTLAHDSKAALQEPWATACQEVLNALTRQCRKTLADLQPDLAARIRALMHEYTVTAALEQMLTSSPPLPGIPQPAAATTAVVSEDEAPKTPRKGRALERQVRA